MTKFNSVGESLHDNLKATVWEPYSNTTLELRERLSESIWNNERLRLKSLVLDKVSDESELSDWSMSHV
jgi:hypothetical protein